MGTRGEGRKITNNYIIGGKKRIPAAHVCDDRLYDDIVEMSVI